MTSILRIAAFEARQQLGSLATVVLMLVLVGYTSMHTLSGESLAEIGAADAPRNCPFIVYHFSSGSCLWLLFFLAYLMTAPVSRDLNSRMAEVCHALPVGPRRYLLGKYLGGLVASHAVALAISASFVLSPWIGRAAGLGPELFGPTPWRAIAQAYLLFMSVMILGVGSLFFAMTVWTGRAAAPYAAAFALMVASMLSITVFWEGGVDGVAGQWLDPTGYNSVLAQVSYWTADERAGGVMELTPPLVANRLVLLAVGGLALALSLRRPDVARLVRGAAASRRVRGGDEPPAGGLAPAHPAHVALRFDAGARLATAARLGLGLFVRHARSASFLLMMAFGLAVMVGGGFLHVLAGKDGRLLPWFGLLWLKTLDFFYLPAALYLCFAASQLVTREREHRLAEVQDALPAPTWLLAAPRIVALAGLSLLLAAIPLLGTWILELAVAPETFAPEGLALTLLVVWPTFFQLAALAFAAYALVTRRWLAHFLAIMAVFVCVVNHELEIVTNSQLQVAMPVHVRYSPLTGAGAWVEPALWLGGWFLAITGILLAIAVWLWPRGTEAGVRARLAAAWSGRSGWQLGAAAALAAAAAGTGWKVDRALRHDNGYRAAIDERAEAAAYERQYGARRGEPAPRILSARAEIELRPAEGEVAVTYTAELGNETGAPIQGIDVEPPERFRLDEIQVGGAPAAGWQVDSALRRHRVRLAGPLAPGQRARLTIRGVAAWRSFANEGDPHPIGPAGAWLVAEDLLPRLGYDRGREIKVAAFRREHGLGARRAPGDGEGAGEARAIAHGLAGTPVPVSIDVRAPAGLSVVVPSAAGDGGHVAGATDGPLRFAVIAGRYDVLRRRWDGPTGPVDVEVYHHPERVRAAEAIAAAAEASLAELSGRYGAYGHGALRVVQAPQHVGQAALYGDVLVLPEPYGWDHAPFDGRHDAVLLHVARTLAEHWWVERLRPALAPGHAVLGEGLPLCSALAVVEAVRGGSVAAGHVDRLVDEVLRELAQAQGDVPPLAEADDEPHVARHAALVLHGVRHEIGAERFDEALRGWLSAAEQGAGASATLAAIRARWEASGGEEVASAFEHVHAWDLRLLRAETVPLSAGRFQVAVDLDARAYELGAGGWRDLDRALDPIELAILDRGGKELARVTGRAAGGRITAEVAAVPAEVVLDPERHVLDRKPHDNRRPVVLVSAQAARSGDAR
ncbi:hypothetical protein [Sorangium sp. So ce861]|uniref:ABC transporter permease/M1 family aminopeptidase n=1 Tax=Sorangium sp. So ce861 TaxID=3133323 RepID=UPI003F63DC13